MSARWHSLKLPVGSVTALNASSLLAGSPAQPERGCPARGAMHSLPPGEPFLAVSRGDSHLDPNNHNSGNLWHGNVRVEMSAALLDHQRSFGFCSWLSVFHHVTGGTSLKHSAENESSALHEVAAQITAVDPSNSQGRVLRQGFAIRKCRISP